MTCKDCIHYKDCKDCDGLMNCEDASCCFYYKDKALFVELPCKVGNTVYIVPTTENGRTEITPMSCLGFSIGNPSNTANCFDEKNNLFQPSFDTFSKTVFLTKEEAEKALEEMKK